MSLTLDPSLKRVRSQSVAGSEVYSEDVAIAKVCEWDRRLAGSPVAETKPHQTRQICAIVSVLHRKNIKSKQEMMQNRPLINHELEGEQIDLADSGLFETALKAYLSHDVSCTPLPTSKSRSPFTMTDSTSSTSLTASTTNLLGESMGSSVPSAATFMGVVTTPVAGCGTSEMQDFPDPLETIVGSTAPTATAAAGVAASTRRPRIFHGEMKMEELYRIADSYDEFRAAVPALTARSTRLLSAIDHQGGVAETEQIIIGTGDTALAVWLQEHRERQEEIPEGSVPSVLMIGEDAGSWGSDYTLAQRHAMLERHSAPYNPRDFVCSETYHQNRHVNARHLYQSNQCNLQKTFAPVVRAKVEGIERRDRPVSGAALWLKPEYSYRITISAGKVEKVERVIYTNKIDICTGLGAASNPLLKVMGRKELERLSQFDPARGCTPIIDGNSYVFEAEEKRARKGRTVVVYGGGGTAAAIYRQVLHGDDWRGEDKTFEECHHCNEVFWIARGDFTASGTGHLATRALTTSQEAGFRAGGYALVEVEEVERPGGKQLALTFTKEGRSYHQYCDQLIYSTGQTDDHLQPLIARLGEQPKALFVKVPRREPIIVGAGVGPDVRLLGAAADAAIAKHYDEPTWEWLHETFIGGDVGPGSMPTTAGQLKLLGAVTGTPILSVNLNNDDPEVIRQFLRARRVKEYVIIGFMRDLLKARKASMPRGFDRGVSEGLLMKHRLNQWFEPHGHSQIKPRG